MTVWNPSGRVAGHIRRVGEANVCTSIIVAAELRYGAEKKASSQLTARVEALLKSLEVLPFAVPADETYASVRVQLEARSRPIGGNDLLIAAQALALRITLVTDNHGEFARVDGLQCENWVRD